MATSIQLAYQPHTVHVSFSRTCTTAPCITHTISAHMLALMLSSVITLNAVVIVCIGPTTTLNKSCTHVLRHLLFNTALVVLVYLFIGVPAGLKVRQHSQSVIPACIEECHTVLSLQRNMLAVYCCSIILHSRVNITTAHCSLHFTVPLQFIVAS